jgi:hypothetical protein
MAEARLAQLHAITGARKLVADFHSVRGRCFVQSPERFRQAIEFLPSIRPRCIQINATSIEPHARSHYRL